MNPKAPMSAARVASVESRSRSSPRAKPWSITVLRPWPITSTIPAESAIATVATAMRARYGRSMRKSGRSLLSCAPRSSAAALDDRAGDRARYEEGAPVLGDLGADRELPICGAPVGGGVFAGELGELGHARALAGSVRLHHGDQVHVAHGALG